jgi:hypothetical protein
MLELTKEEMAFLVAVLNQVQVDRKGARPLLSILEKLEKMEMKK